MARRVEEYDPSDIEEQERRRRLVGASYIPEPITPTTTATTETGIPQVGGESNPFDPVNENERRIREAAYVPESYQAPPSAMPQVPAAPPTYAPTQPAAAPSYANRYQSIVDAYNQYLGRTPSEAEILSQTGQGSFDPTDKRIGYSVNNIRTSPEASAYAARSATPAVETPAAVAANAPSQTAMPGWNEQKWDDPSHTTPKYVVGRILSGFPSTPAGLQAALAEIQKQFPGTTLVGKDTLNIPGVGMIDVGVNFSQGGTGWAWQPDGQTPAAAQPSTGATGTTGATGGATAASFQQALYQQAIKALQGGTAPATAQPASPAQPSPQTQTSASTASPWAASPAVTNAEAAGGKPYDEAIRRMVLQLMRQQPVDMNDPVYRQAMSAYGLQQQRAKERNRNAIAERAAAEGTLNTGGFSDRVLGAEQAQGEAEASFAGNLATRELERQRQEIMQALTLGAGLMTDEQRLQLTEKLGLIDAAIQQQSVSNQAQSIQNQADQFTSSLGWEQAQWPSQQNYLAWLMAQNG